MMRAPSGNIFHLKNDESLMKKSELKKVLKPLIKECIKDAIGKQTYNGVNLFEGTTPAPAGPAPGAAPSPQGALSGVAATDKGVDITGLFGSVANNWSAHMSDIKEGK